MTRPATTAKPKRNLRAYPEPNAKPVSLNDLQKSFFTRIPKAERYRQQFGRGLTLDRIETSLASARGGFMRDLTDLSRETIDTDPHLAAVLGKRLNVLAALPIALVPATGPGIDKERADFYAQVVRDQVVQIHHFSQAVLRLAWGTFDGRAALEKDWVIYRGPEHPKFGSARLAVRSLGWIHPRRLMFGPQRELRVSDSPYAGYDFAPIGLALRDVANKFVEFTPQLFGEYQEREGLAPRCLYWSFFKRFAARERQILLELYGKPWRIVEVDSDSNTDQPDLDSADEVVDGLGAHHTARMPRGTKLTIVSPQKNAGQIHDEVITESDKQISKLVLGQTGTTDGVAAGFNSNTIATLKDEQIAIMIGDAKNLSEALEDGLSDSIIEVNFGIEALSHAPRFVLRSDIPADRDTELSRLDKALGAGLSVSISEAYEVSGFRQPNSDEAVVRIDQPPQAPLAPNPPNPRPVIVWPSGATPPVGEQQPPALEARPVLDEEPATKGEVVVGADAPKNLLNPSDLAAVISVDEARASVGLPALGPPDGMLSVEEYRAKKVAKGEAQGAAQGGAPPGGNPGSGQPGGAAPPPPATPPPAPRPPPEPSPVTRPAPDDGDPAPLGDDRAAAPPIAAQRRAFAVVYDATGDARLAEECAEAFAEEAVELARRYSADPPARQPETTFGSAEDVVDRGALEASRLTPAWVDVFVAAAGNHSRASALYGAVNRAAEAIDIQPVARALERQLVHGLMLGALDADYEGREGVVIKPATFAREDLSVVKPSFSKLRYDGAAKWFREKKIIQRGEFEQLTGVAKRRAFSVAANLSRQALRVVHAELAKQISDGADLRDFGKQLKDRLTRAGFVRSATPTVLGTGASHVENVFRTNVLDAYNSGRFKQMSQPAVLRALPLWQIRGVDDSRTRDTHRAAHGLTLEASDPFWSHAAPPFSWNCRCRCISVSRKPGVKIVRGASIAGLPDPEFTSGISSLLLSST